jgi:UDPglucose--hexose-1-phosphate uridylyltransferase
MPELRKDPITREWVIIATERARRPDQFNHKRQAEIVVTKDHSTCPFCPGNEAMTPPEVLAYRPGGTAPNQPGWTLRVVPNAFPALNLESSWGRRDAGIYDTMGGYGVHEVIVEHPDHQQEMWTMDDQAVEDILWACRDRYVDLKRDDRLLHIMIFRNHGRVAGASIQHPHSQLVGTPFVPQMIWHELQGAQQYVDYRDTCAFCDVVQDELRNGERLISANDHFVCVAPYASKVPFETSIIPKRHNGCFANMTREEVRALASILKDLKGRLAACLDDPPYNHTFHTAPIREENNPHFHWHLSILPRLTIAAGFELGTGIYINVTPPEEAAHYLRETTLPSDKRGAG